MGSVIHVLGDSCLFVGDGLRLDVHTPHAFEICVAVQGRFVARTVTIGGFAPLFDVGQRLRNEQFIGFWRKKSYPRVDDSPVTDQEHSD